MEIETLYKKLISFGFRFRIENNATVKMSSETMDNDDLRYLEWRQLVGMITEDIKLPVEDEKNIKRAEKKAELFKYIFDRYCFSPQKCSNWVGATVKKVLEEVPEDGVVWEWLTNRYPRAREISLGILKEIDNCHKTQDMFLLERLLKEYLSLWKEIKREYNFVKGKCWTEIKNDSDNPFFSGVKVAVLDDVESKVEEIRNNYKNKNKRRKDESSLWVREQMQE